MKKFAIALTAVAALGAEPAAFAADVQTLSHWSETGAEAVDHSAWGEFLSKYVVPGENGEPNRVRYGAVTPEDRQRLEGYIEQLTSLDPTALGRDEAFAYWANLYNALTVRLIIEHYPVKSIREIKPSFLALGPWGMPAATVDGVTLSLDDIEHKILRGGWKDPRVHYSVNCASIGCPNLQPKPFTGAGLDAELNAAAHDYVNSPRGAHFDKSGRLVASSIYKWYQVDFGGGEKGVIAHMSKFAAPDLAGRLKTVTGIYTFEYDWSLNDAS